MPDLVSIGFWNVQVLSKAPRTSLDGVAFLSTERKLQSITSRLTEREMTIRTWRLDIWQLKHVQEVSSRCASFYISRRLYGNVNVNSKWKKTTPKCFATILEPFYYPSKTRNRREKFVLQHKTLIHHYSYVFTLRHGQTSCSSLSARARLLGKWPRSQEPLVPWLDRFPGRKLLDLLKRECL